MEKQEFENLIAQAVEALPSSIRKKMDNVGIVLEEGESPNNSLFGLYHGISQARRGSSYGMNPTLPDKITIYKATIEKFALRPFRQTHGGQVVSNAEPQAQGLSAGDEELAIRSLVRRVVWHEIGHHFGFDEAKIRKLERKWEKEGKV
ncbi:MAG: metallopeptidase family protein [Patescibacteria group bacterium]